MVSGVISAQMQALCFHTCLWLPSWALLKAAQSHPSSSHQAPQLFHSHHCNLTVSPAPRLSVDGGEGRQVTSNTICSPRPGLGEGDVTSGHAKIPTALVSFTASISLSLNRFWEDHFQNAFNNNNNTFRWSCESPLWPINLVCHSLALLQDSPEQNLLHVPPPADGFLLFYLFFQLYHFTNPY